MISVICPIFNEEKYIVKCVESVLQQDYPQTDMEILFIDGMSSDRTREIVSVYSKKYNNIKLFDNPNHTVPYAMNIGIKAAKGDIIVRLDAHAEYPVNYISTLTNVLIDKSCDNVGAPCITDVINKNPKTLAIREVLCNKFGIGNSAFRTGINETKEVDTVPFGCWNRKVFDQYGLYDTRLTRNQDIELNKRIINGGGHIFITPQTYSIYYARETFTAIAKNNYQNGKWNIMTVYYTGQFKSLSIRHFIPLIFLLSLTIPIIFSLVTPWALTITALSSVAYLTLIMFISISLSLRKGLDFVFLIKAFITLHFSYGYGSLVGIFKIISHRI